MVRINTTCRCSAYSFPHRLSGGKCSGREWAESFIRLFRNECEFCRNKNNDHCDVAIGVENIKTCQNAHTNIPLLLPMHTEEYLDNKRCEYESRRPPEYYAHIEQIPF
jgi:hypothetical protein